MYLVGLDGSKKEYWKGLGELRYHRLLTGAPHATCYHKLSWEQTVQSMQETETNIKYQKNVQGWQNQLGKPSSAKSDVFLHNV